MWYSKFIVVSRRNTIISKNQPAIHLIKTQRPTVLSDDFYLHTKSPRRIIETFKFTNRQQTQSWTGTISLSEIFRTR